MKEQQILSPDAETAKPAESIGEVYVNFDPAVPLPAGSHFYAPRREEALVRLKTILEKNRGTGCYFLCGHRGSGKTTELNRLKLDNNLAQKYIPIYITIGEFGKDSADLTHDAVLLEIGLSLARHLKTIDEKAAAVYETELGDWGRQIIRSAVKNVSAEMEAGLRGDAWLAYFKSMLRSRKEWTTQEILTLEPKVLDLVFILDRLAQEIENRTQKLPLVIVDDLEKGESGAHRDMHRRLFDEHLDMLTKPRVNVIYTLPVYYRAKHEAALLARGLFSFAAVRIYPNKEKDKPIPALETEGEGYKLMYEFIMKRIADRGLFAPGTVEELIRIGGGLFRDTQRAVFEAALNAMMDKREQISAGDVQKVFDAFKKEYQPQIRGEAAEILLNVLETPSGWVEGVEPFLMSRAVMEYENGEIWLDVRYALKEYVRRLKKT